MRPRVAVFGIGGFSGRSFERFVHRESLAEAYDFHGHARETARAARTASFTYHQGNAEDTGEVRRFMAEVRPDFVINLAGRFRAADLGAYIAANVGISHAICQAVLELGLEPKKILLVGSAAEYGAVTANPVPEEAPTEPLNPYGLSKLFQTLLASYYFRSHGLPIVVARTFNIVGEGLSTDLSIGSFAAQIESLPDGGTIDVGDLGSSRDFLDVDEVARRYWVLLQKGEPGQIYNICSGQPRTIRSLLDELIDRSGKRLQTRIDPARLKSRDIPLIYGDPAKFEMLEA